MTTALFAQTVPLPPPRELGPVAANEKIVSIIVALAFVACLAVALRTWRREGDSIGLFLLAGGALAVLQEPMVDVLGNIWVRSDLTVFETFGRPMPVWAILAYAIFWGFQPFALVRLADRGFSMRQYRLGIAVAFLVNLLIELPPLAMDMYLYYGRQPFEVFGLPLHWLFINSAGMVVVAAVVHSQRDFFRGRRVALVALLAPVLVPAASLATGLPVLTALNSPAVPDAILWLAAMVTAAIGLVIIEVAGRQMASVPDPRRANQPVRERASSAARTSRWRTGGSRAGSSARRPAR